MVNSNFIWCYRKDCKFNMPAAEDRNGKFGLCKKEEVVIDVNGKCESLKIRDIADEDKDFDILREGQDYADEVGKNGRFDIK